MNIAYCFLYWNKRPDAKDIKHQGLAGIRRINMKGKRYEATRKRLINKVVGGRQNKRDKEPWKGFQEMRRRGRQKM